ncbi:DUF6624 domain-containing protein [Solitalea lacus]|uniref:DUF6624 domain-containing protein n=1 Tax=Solitalea lacus TaxID=2911172 RepID=UPI001EDB9B51|nr:DUF6624 domain-containing protein [Solitalea lacus]UKJ09340.1 hypothetical protein L2B55_09305 [Solitalea lacus]
MRKFYVFILIYVLFGISFSKAQSEVYLHLIKTADSLFYFKEYKKSTYAYTWAFRVNNYRSTLNDRYKAGRAWSQYGVPDSAYFHLLKIAEQGNFIDYDRVIADEAFKPIQNDPRWVKFTNAVKQNHQRAEANLDQTLKAQLDTIHDNLLHWHAKLDSVKRKHPKDSIKIAEITKTVSYKDSLYKEIVTDLWKAIGWIGPNVVGKKARDAQFYVLKFASLYTQKKYYPLFKKAVKDDFATLEQMAIIEDIMALKQGKKQIYGTQLAYDNKGNYYLQPIESQTKTNQLRAEIGLIPLEEYLKDYGID